MQRFVYVLALLMIATMPWEGQLVLSGLGTLSRLFGLIVAGLWVLLVLLRGRFRQIAPFHLFFFLFFAWNGLSLLWSIDPGATMNRLETYIQMAGMAVLFWDLFETKAQVRAGLQAYVLGAYLPIWSTISNYLANIQSDFGRFSSSGDNANGTAVLMALALPLAWYLIVNRDESSPASGLLRWLNILFLPLAVFAIALTATRFAMLMAVPTIAYVVSTVPRMRLLPRTAFFLLATVTILYLPTLIPESTIQRLSTLDEELLQGDFNGRLVFWDLGVELWNEHPLIGIGSAAFDTAVAPVFGRPRSAHNSFVAIASELGLVGLILFILILITALVQAGRHPPQEARFWLAFLSVWGVANLALTWAHNKPTWLMLSFLGISLALHQRAETVVDSSSRTQFDPLPALPLLGGEIRGLLPPPSSYPPRIGPPPVGGRRPAPTGEG